jgi:hypothetical protein
MTNWVPMTRTTIGALSWFTRHTYTRVFTKLLIDYCILGITSWCSLLINCSLLLVQPATTISYISRTRASLRKTDNGTYINEGGMLQLVAIN